MFLCFIKPILENRYVRSRGFIVIEPRETHTRSEITDVPNSPFPPSDNLGCLDPHPAPSTTLATTVPSSSSSNGPTTTTLTTRGLCPGGSVVWAGTKFGHGATIARPPAHMNHVKIVKGWPPRDAPSKLVQLWYKTSERDQGGQLKMKKPTILSNKTSAA